MPPNSEIEKLERRWKENPKGTVFAPYAEVLRKHGDHELARDVLRQGLELHPDHIPGNIVLGRCCLDLREDGPAEAAFTHVLDLDQENVIALKALADITERQGRLMEARNWLARLMSVDPSNDEARDQLERVESAREAAAAVMTAPLAEAPRAEATETVEIIARPPERGAAAVEVASGSVEAGPEETLDDALDAAIDRFATPPASRAMPSPADLERTIPTRRIPTPDEADTVPVLPLVPREPAPIMDLEPVEFDAAQAAADLPSEEMPGLEIDEPFTPPPPVAPAPQALGFGVEEASDIEIQPAGASEFQAPDDSAELLNMAVGDSEFQVPDASTELGRLTGSGSSEYQSPSGSDELLAGLDEEPEPEVPSVATAPPDTRPAVPPGMVTTGFAAITLMPTVELPTDIPPEPPAASTELAFIAEAPDPGAITVEEELAAAAAREPEANPQESEPAWEEELSAPAAAADSGTIEDDQPPAPLKLIFPEEASVPEPPRVRRISEQVRYQPEPAPAPEPVAEVSVPEPEPVVTESMAELYARQGRVAEAINVYQTLLAQQPNDPRLLERLRALEQQRAAGSRRLSYVAMDTGGESVESFFKSLAGARPAGADAPPLEDDGSGAPTRPARDPLSLSAIFGEEPAAAQRAPEAPPRSGTPDAFSFDQFFGSNPGGTASTGPRPAMPTDEDLDQFQHWLKSLKK